MSNEQKLREALQVAEAALSDIGDADREPGDDLAWCERRAAQSLPRIRQALALPTADHLPDAGKMVVDHFPDATKMIETAAPVGEHEVFEREMMDKYGWQHEDFKLDDFGYADGQTDTAWMAWQARAAMSAGDAVDVQRYRWLREQNDDDFSFAVVKNPHFDVYESPEELDAAIDAAMRKDKP